MTPLIMEPPGAIHEPVLLGEVIEWLVTDPNGLYLDATVGLAGHAEAILRTISAQGKLLGMDMDPEALQLAAARLEPLAGRVRLIHANFSDLGQQLEKEKFFPLMGALFDLGVSSLHLDKPYRGFSFQAKGPLDMRMDPANPLTAARILNEWPEEQLALLLKEYGQERLYRRIARWIIERRAMTPFESTLDLSHLLTSKIRRSPGGIHPATRTFLALRIAVNRELENLTRGLEGVLPFMATGGRIAVITFHSLEDRIVKNVLRSFETQRMCRNLTPSPIRPSSEEATANPRSRSAKLRVVERQ